MVYTDTESNSGAIWESRFEGLMRFCAQVNWTPVSKEYYSMLAQHVLGCTDFDTVTLRRYTLTECKNLAFATRFGDDFPEIGDFLQNIPLTFGNMARIMASVEPDVLYYENPGEFDDPTTMARVASLGFKITIMVKLLYGSEVIGDITLSSRTRSSIDQGEIYYLKAIAEAASSFLNSGLMYERVVEASVLDERRRLCLEIRDSMLHLLNTLRIESEQALNSYWEHDGDSLERTLMLLEKSSLEAVNVLRDEMALIRSTHKSSSNLTEDLAQLLKRFEYMWGIQTNLKATADEILLSSNTLMQVTQVIHEALTNVYRHAHASHVRVEIERDDKILVRVSDDGIGFDVNSVTSDRMGIRVMRERMSSIGGKLVIESTPESGTVVLLVFDDDAR